MLRTVQLVHVLPSGDQHVDWLIEKQRGIHAPLLAYRINTPLDNLPPGSDIHATHIADHRRQYLWYQGPVSRQRGHVMQHTTGFVTAPIRHNSGHLARLTLTWIRRRDQHQSTPCWTTQTIEFNPINAESHAPGESSWRISVV